MANPLPITMKKGLLGELLVQLRLLQYGVQAAPPLIDTGNDLIALKGFVCRSIQVKAKTSGEAAFDSVEKDRDFDILALVNLKFEGEEIHLDDCDIYLLWKAEGIKTYYSLQELRERRFEMTKTRVDELFSPSKEGGLISLVPRGI